MVFWFRRKKYTEIHCHPFPKRFPISQPHTAAGSSADKGAKPPFSWSSSSSVVALAASWASWRNAHRQCERTASAISQLNQDSFLKIHPSMVPGKNPPLWKFDFVDRFTNKFWGQTHSKTPVALNPQHPGSPGVILQQKPMEGNQPGRCERPGPTWLKPLEEGAGNWNGEAAGSVVKEGRKAAKGLAGGAVAAAAVATAAAGGGTPSGASPSASAQRPFHTVHEGIGGAGFILRPPGSPPSPSAGRTQGGGPKSGRLSRAQRRSFIKKPRFLLRASLFLNWALVG